MKILASYNIKGGVGKTATAVNLAYLSALDGARTLVWDLDPQGAATFYFRVRPRVKGGGKRLIRRKHALERSIRGTDYKLLDLLPADFSYRHLDLFLNQLNKPFKRLTRLLRSLESRYDYVFIDCPPSISLVSDAVFAAADAVVVPTIPTPLSLNALHQLLVYVNRMNGRPPKILPFFCMVDLRKTLHRDICGHGGDAKAGFLSTRIPYSSDVERMGVQREPLPRYAPGNPATRVYRDLWREILGRLDVYSGGVGKTDAVRSVHSIEPSQP